jgi:hypothetical protein
VGGGSIASSIRKDWAKQIELIGSRSSKSNMESRMFGRKAECLDLVMNDEQRVQ